MRMRVFRVVKMATVLEGCATEEQRFVVRFFVENGPNAKDINE
jgi:hypothetical protein